jgi:NAD(P)-dependent dehydrogenase (short-subunit alcohol dehydrogenase family)
MHIALTGYNGFVGKIITEALEEAGHRVYGTSMHGNHLTLMEDEIECLIHCARDAANLVEPIDQTKWMNEYKTDVVDPYYYTMEMIDINPNLNNIIFITSIYGLRVPTVRYIPMNYSIAKAAERYLAENLAVTLAPKIRVNVLMLGGVHSDRELANQTDDFREKYHAHTSLNRMVQPDEIGGAIRFLVSDESKGMTGATIKIDGGYTLI